MTAQGLFISWTSFHGRSQGIADFLGASSRYIRAEEGPLIIRYAKQWRKTRNLIKRLQPAYIMVMQPPILALLAVKSLPEGRRALVVGDFHSGAFIDPKWRWSLSWAMKLLGKMGVAIVTNSHLAKVAQKYTRHVIELHDPISIIDKPSSSQGSKSTVLVPLAYANDEPLKKILEAASMTPEIEWRLTGKAPMWMRRQAPPNVTFLGYIPNEKYWVEFHNAGAIAALVNRENTMQRAGYEALSAGKALVTSDTSVLRGYFGEAATYTAPSAGAISRAVMLTLRDSAALEKEMRALREIRMRDQRGALSQLAQYLEPSCR